MAAKKSATLPATKPKKTKHHFSLSQMAAVRRLRRLRARRAHKSLVLTRRRDIPRPAPLPGYISFTLSVMRAIREYWRPFMTLLVLYVVVALVLVGLTQQDQLRNVTDSIEEINQQLDGNVLDTATKVTTLIGATLTGTVNASLSDIQQFYMALVYTLMWLVIVWLLRHLLAGNAIRLRDALYNAGAPLVSTICIILMMLLQVLPGAVGAFIFSLSLQSSVIPAGAAAMAFGILAILLIVLSMYWLTSSFFALLIVTIPGTYPMSAIRGASELVLGRRMALLLRLLWLVALLVIVWTVLLVPAFLIDLWMKVSWLPLVTIMIHVATACSFIVGVSYIYLLYRRMVDEPAH